MPIYLRRFYLKRIESAINNENKEIDKIQNNKASIQAPPKVSQKYKK